ncbi:hypothetical protein F3Y22_tig00110332pilonHSYRG00787 [Hibiscus syriacus]|uniref:Uncharacterized protein n=1 Tax=Hibiscus syriacus TaxID=106335 RepID=A0A6A3B115_HIBSY|nr:hypothetical protein F3Y22_tig00110332pilonHSYRG00787 [Hibiscus syriacus]
MLACWVEDPNGIYFKKHLARFDEFVWVGEDGIKSQSFGSQAWDAILFLQALLASNLADEIGPTLMKGHNFLKNSQFSPDNANVAINFFGLIEILRLEMILRGTLKECLGTFLKDHGHSLIEIMDGKSPIVLQKAESKCALVYGQTNEPPGALARVGLTGLTVAEHFRDAVKYVELKESITSFQDSGLFLPSKPYDNPKGTPIAPYPSMVDLLLQGCSKIIENDDREVDKYPMFRTGLGKSMALKKSSIAKALSILDEEDGASTVTPSGRSLSVSSEAFKRARSLLGEPELGDLFDLDLLRCFLFTNAANFSGASFAGASCGVFTIACCLYFSMMKPEMVGEKIETEQFYDAVNLFYIYRVKVVVFHLGNQ